MQEFQLQSKILRIKKNTIYKQYEKEKSVTFLSNIFHVARNTIYRAIKDIDKKK